MDGVSEYISSMDKFSSRLIIISPYIFFRINNLKLEDGAKVISDNIDKGSLSYFSSALSFGNFISLNQLPFPIIEGIIICASSKLIIIYENTKKPLQFVVQQNLRELL